MRQWVNTIAASWFALWFSPISALRLELYRIAICLSMIPYFAYYFWHGREWLTKEGLHLPLALMPAYVVLDLPLLPEQAVGLFATVFFASLLCLLFAFCKRVSAAVLFACVAYVTQADYISSFTMNKMFLLSLLLLAVAPAINGRATSEAWPVRVLQGTLLLMYFGCGINKLLQGDWFAHPDLLRVMADGVFRNERTV